MIQGFQGRIRLKESLLHKACAATAAAAVKKPSERRDLLEDIERVRNRAAAALGVAKQPSVHKVQQALVRVGARELAQELAHTIQGRRACAPPWGADLPDRVEAALAAGREKAFQDGGGRGRQWTGSRGRRPGR